MDEGGLLLSKKFLVVESQSAIHLLDSLVWGRRHVLDVLRKLQFLELSCPWFQGDDTGTIAVGSVPDAFFYVIVICSQGILIQRDLEKWVRYG